MRWPFFLKQPAALVEAYRKIDKLTTESAAKDMTIESLDRVAGIYRTKLGEAVNQASNLRAERDALQARLEALTPARREDGRFVAKARRLEPANPPASIAGHGMEDFA